MIVFVEDKISGNGMGVLEWLHVVGRFIVMYTVGIPVEIEMANI